MVGSPELTSGSRHPAVLEAAGLSKRFGSLAVLKDVSFRIRRGEALAILGPSGVGKTTLLKCLNGLTGLDNGVVSLDGEEVLRATSGVTQSRIPLANVRRHIGMVFQEWNLWPNRTVRENVAEGPRVILGRPKSSALSEADVLCERVGLGNKLHSYPHELSGGQKQRAAIARALAMRPKVLMLDEITSALDPPLIADILDVILSLRRDGQTLMIVTHHVDFAKEAATNVAFMTHGVFREYGPARSVLQQPSTPELARFLGVLARTH